MRSFLSLILVALLSPWFPTFAQETLPDQVESDQPRENSQKFKIPNFQELLEHPKLKKLSEPTQAWIENEKGIRAARNPYYRYLYEKKRAEKEIEQELKDFSVQAENETATFDNANKLKQLKITEDQLYMLRKHSTLPIFYMGFRHDFHQGLTLDRLYVFVEGDPGKILPDEELNNYLYRNLHFGAGGHDYRASDIAAFFNAAAKAKVKLNPMEERLLAELKKLGLMKQVESGLEASSEVALISAYAKSLHYAIDHEFNHALYFTDKAYRQTAQELWNDLDDQDKNLVRELMLATFSDVYAFEQDEDLFLREFIAYFRAPQDLIKHYIEPIGKEILESNDPIQIQAQKYFDRHGYLQKEIVRRIIHLGERVLSIDAKSKGYVPDQPDEKPLEGASFNERAKDIIDFAIPTVSSHQCPA